MACFTAGQSSFRRREGSDKCTYFTLCRICEGGSDVVSSTQQQEQMRAVGHVLCCDSPRLSLLLTAARHVLNGCRWNLTAARSMKMLKCLKSTCHGGQAFCFRDETARWSLCVTRATEQPITARLPLFNRPALIGVFIITMTLLQHFYFYLFTQIFRWKPLFWCRCLYKDNSTHLDVIETLTVASASKYKANLFIRKFHRSPQ